jgi:DNA-binding NtrC family response regulator
VTSDQRLAADSNDGRHTPSGPGRVKVGINLKALLDAYERQLIQTALAAASGHQRRAAASLGLLPTTLHEKMKRLGLVKRASGPDGAPEPEPDDPATA